MSVAEAAHRSRHPGRTVALWLAFIVVIGAAVGLAWVGAGALRPEVTASGLQFRTIKDGKGDPIGPQDAALLDYVGTLDDGTVFDASSNHGGPQPFTIGSVFPGFGEAMTRMQEGGHYKFTMPPRLAFGDKPPPQGFPKDSNLTFEVQVRKIVRNGAMLMGGGAAPQQGEQPQQPEQPQPPEQPQQSQE
ncbi:MAG: FKBP-type peptidyl-prolyl cis-trans isomerase [Sphingomicrobium sp.]